MVIFLAMLENSLLSMDEKLKVTSLTKNDVQSWPSHNYLF